MSGLEIWRWKDKITSFPWGAQYRWRYRHGQSMFTWQGHAIPMSTSPPTQGDTMAGCPGGGSAEACLAQPEWKHCWKKGSGFGTMLEVICSTKRGEGYCWWPEEQGQRWESSMIPLQLPLTSELNSSQFYHHIFWSVLLCHYNANESQPCISLLDYDYYLGSAL